MGFNESFATTRIGPFPHEEEREAFRLVLENFPEIPFWPKFPKRSFLEGMVAQYSEGFPCIRLNEKEQKVWVETSQWSEKELEKFYEWFENGKLGRLRIT
jgi:hypothetical protein